MLNNDIFISRLEDIMEKNQLSAAAFERIGVQDLQFLTFYQNEINQA